MMLTEQACECGSPNASWRDGELEGSRIFCCDECAARSSLSPEVTARIFAKIEAMQNRGAQIPGVTGTWIISQLNAILTDIRPLAAVAQAAIQETRAEQAFEHHGTSQKTLLVDSRARRRGAVLAFLDPAQQTTEE